MAVDFSRYTNYRDDAGVSGVVFGSGSTVLEVELNEMQEIQKHMMREFVKNIAGNGITDISKITYSNGYINIADGCYIIHEGYIINIGDSMKIVYKPSYDVYMDIWEEDITNDDTLYKYGNTSTAIVVNNWIKDDRAGNITTKRKVVRYGLSNISDTSNINPTEKHDFLYAGRTVTGYRIPIARVVNGGIEVLINDISHDKSMDDINDIYGVEVDWQSNKFTRIAGSVGKIGGTDHDDISAFKRRRCNVTDDGIVTAYYGDVGYTESGATNRAITINSTTIPIGTKVQVMVEQKKFYYKVVPLKLEELSDGTGYAVRKARYYLSNTPMDGFKVHPAFIRNGIEIDKIYIGAYKASLYDASSQSIDINDTIVADLSADKLSSVSGGKPMSGKSNTLNLSNCRKLCANRGAKWQVKDFTMMNMDIYLFLIEYGKLNIQDVIGMGYVGLGNASANMSNITGSTSNFGNSSGIVSGTKNTTSITYRGEEDIFGSLWELIDGVNIEANNKNIAYWSNNNFAEGVGTSPYKSCGFTIKKSDGYIGAFGCSSDCDWAFLPVGSNGIDNGLIADYADVEPSYSGWLVLKYGGYWNSTYRAGICCVDITDPSTNHSSGDTGVRIAYIP